MQKLKSKNGREFYLDEDRTDPFEGLPCFSWSEIKLLKTRALTDSEINFIFDAKIAVGVTVEEIYTAKPPQLSPYEDIGYKPITKPKDESIYSSSRALEAKDWASRIKEHIQNTSLRGIKKQPVSDIVAEYIVTKVDASYESKN